MITETQPCVIILQLTDALTEQLQPFLAGLDITACTVEHTTQRLTMRVEVYQALTQRVGSALDYDVRWQPNEYEPDGFVERVRPLEITNGLLALAGCLHCGAQLLATHAEVVGGLASLAGTPRRPDTEVSGRLFVCSTFAWA